MFGIGLYQSNFKTVIEGKNLAFVGLSSGKLIAYLKFGVPVITNEIGQLSDCIRKYKLGQAVTYVNEINPAEIEKIQNCRENCIEYFKGNLDFNLKSSQLLELISDSINGKIDNNKINSFNNDSSFSYSKSHIEQIKYYFNLARDLENSKYYHLGYSLYNPKLIFNKSMKLIKSIVRKTIHRYQK